MTYTAKNYYFHPNFKYLLSNYIIIHPYICMIKYYMVESYYNNTVSAFSTETTKIVIAVCVSNNH